MKEWLKSASLQNVNLHNIWFFYIIICNRWILTILLRTNNNDNIHKGEHLLKDAS